MEPANDNVGFGWGGEVKRLAGYVLLILLATMPAWAQSLTISASMLSTFPLTSDPTSTQTLTVTTTVGGFLLVIPQTSVCAYMTQSMKGTGTNTTSIPDTSVQLNSTSIVTGGTNCGVATAFQIASHASAFCFCASKEYTDSATVRIAGYPTTLEADTYTGTITLVATAQ
jgi:hypothetical protein